MSGSSSEYTSDSSSEDEAPRRLLPRPKFIPKSQRNNQSPSTTATPADAPLSPTSRRRAAADDLVQDQIKKQLAERQSAKKHWESDADAGSDPDADSDVDTTDGLDPEAEEAAWRLRELHRLHRARLAIEAREAETAEKERRQNLSATERAAEDKARLAAQHADQDPRGKMAYMQRYFHKGAFFRDDGEAMGLLQRDIMGTRIADDVRDRSALPEYLQRRDMAKLGRKGATRYKDMRAEDTGRWGDWDDRPRRDGDRFGGGRDEDERFRRDYGDGGKGANAMPLGQRRPGREEKRGDDRRGDDRKGNGRRGDDREGDNRDDNRGDDRRGDSRRGDYREGDNRDDDRKGDDRRDDDRRGGGRRGDDIRDRQGDRNDYIRRKRSISRDRFDSDKRRRVDTR